VDDSVDELGGGEFGSLLHDVLKTFGENAVAASDIASDIDAELSRLLDTAVERQFGKRPLSAVAVQIEQIRLRLRLFAQWQAGWVREGWKIQVTEGDTKEGTAAFVVDDQPIYLRGRIDRIDYNPGTGEIVVFDYKTGDSAKRPEETHNRRDEWVDLQLPLYRHLVRHMEKLRDVDYSTVHLGYIVIPKAAEKIGHHLAGWTAEELDHADDTARNVVRAIRAGCFWPPVDPPPAFFEEFSAICLDEQFGVVSVADNAEETQ
jgi:RecB family exonuclease